MADHAATKARAVAVLKKLPAFRGLADHEYFDVFEVCRSRFVHSGEILFREGDRAGSLFILLNGAMEILVEGRGLVHVMQAGEVLGEMGLVCDDVRTASAVARDSCMLLELDADRLHALMEQKPRIGYVIMGNLAAILAARLKKENVRI
ncbi:MAG: hypothetical protein Kow0092_23820 [Deferrisomatales bacterium]